MEKGRAPLPSIASLVAVPESVEDAFGEARAEGAGGVNVLVSYPPPLVHSNCLVPDAPHEGGFFLSSARLPGIIPVGGCVTGQNSSPLRPAQVHGSVVSEPSAGEFGRKL